MGRLWLWGVLVVPTLAYAFAWLSLPIDFGAPGPMDPGRFVGPRVTAAVGLACGVACTVAIWVVVMRNKNLPFAFWPLSSPLITAGLGTVGMYTVGIYPAFQL
ncbi:hypothetical protein GCM10010988_40560 [Cnuibacter physcomitrellae]|uniref:Uncharacterized protein n=2 Tax=Cnuibacter physcomitrellae TaxID=1619308 RepID=A0A1X9LTI3_9MICO|nr:hypothetical protein B5808_19815 [Cnuibacter physcomitrellae]GGI42742.1 hypothetical protein GCM10010988_40560 [Cnuibacter physcomitrellae]